MVSRNPSESRKEANPITQTFERKADLESSSPPNHRTWILFFPRVELSSPLQDLQENITFGRM
jgi:hypothetical protein